MNHHPQDLAQRGSHELTTPTPIGNLAQGSMFWQPDYLQPSAWLEHLPALFWLVEAVKPSQCLTLGVHQGAAHFAVCQAVSRLRLDARCYGVQPREGLEEAAAADFQAVRDYHARHYSGVSRLMDTTPQAALSQFAQGSLDLVVVNLPPETANIASLVDLALTRLSPRGVIVLPHIERREPGARLHEAFDRLAQQHPGFAFVHGDGMGVVAVGSTPSSTLQTLLDAAEAPGSRQVLRDVFQRLGRSCADAVESQQARQRAEQLAREVETLGQAHERRAEELEALREQLSEQGRHHARELGQQEARVEMLQELRDELQAELRELQARGPAFVNSEREPADTSHQQAALAEQLQAVEQERDEAKASLEARFKELAQLTRMLEEQRTQAEQASQAAEQHQAELAKVRQALEEERAARQAAASQQQAAEARLAELEQQLAEARAQAQHAEEADALRERLAAAEASLQARFAELATLTEMLEESEQAREALETRVQTLENERDALPADTEPFDAPEASASETAQTTETGEQAEPADDETTPAITPPGAIYRQDPERLKQDIDLLQQSEWFDAEWYLKRYPDIAEHPRFSQEPLVHYLMHGGFEGRNPGPEFDSAFYLKRYNDVRERGTNPLVHYLRYGQHEQRQVSAE